MKILISLTLLILSANIFAHCPSFYKEQNLCFMIDDNTLYSWDKKFEHNGPYKDFEEGTQIISIINTSNKQELKYTKVARGIFKIEGSEKIAAAVLKFQFKKIIAEIKIEKER